MAVKSVLSVGQCSADHARLSSYLRQHFQVEVTAVESEAEALQRLATESFELVLVNRLFDADGASGLDFIRRLKKESEVGVMLVSNYEEAQREAVEAGALAGFGKAALGQPATEHCLRQTLASPKV